MAVETSLAALLSTLTESLTSAANSSPDASLAIPPKDGISLLDVKNELLLSYLQNLVFLIILKLRNRANASDSDEDEEDLEDAVVRKLVELRVYLEKGVRPLEGRLKYQIDKVLRAADDAARAAAPKSNGTSKKSTANDSKEDGSDDSDSDVGSADGVVLKASEIDDLQYRPNPAALVRPEAPAEEVNFKRSSDGIYRPPRITATAMPTTGPREKREKPQKSATLDEFINTELSTAPLSEPSIGSTILFGGRRSKSEKERKEELERKEYEEKNYTRLPKESKKDRAKKGGRKDAGYGGEEWRGLGEGIDRIEKLTKRKSGESRNVVEKSRKRPIDDGPRDSCAADGQGLQKRVKTLDIGRRDRGRGRK